MKEEREGWKGIEGREGGRDGKGLKEEREGGRERD